MRSNQLSDTPKAAGITPARKIIAQVPVFGKLKKLENEAKNRRRNGRHTSA